MVVRTRTPDATGRHDDDRHEDEQHPGEASPYAHDDHRDKDEGKELLQEFGQHAGHGELDALDVVDDRRQQRAGGVLLEESDRAAQRRVVKFVAQIGGHTEAGVVRQIGAAVIEDSLEDGGDDQCKGDDGPDVVEVLRNKRSQVPLDAKEWNRQQRKRARLRTGIEHLIENGAQQQHTKGVEQPYQRHRDHRCQQVKPVGLEVPEKAIYSTHSLLRSAPKRWGAAAQASTLGRIGANHRFYWN